MSFSSKQIFHEHKDLVHHVAYDFHGKRIATCSSDQSVTVWDLNQNGIWVRSSSWKTHGGPVWKVIWAHPEFGQILATCSFDRSAHIWEEVVSDNDPERQGGRSQQKSGPTTHWKKRTALVDSRSNVTDIKFAPRHLGLMLATASAQGVVRIYEAPDIMDLARWNLCQDFSVSRYRCSCVSWSSSRFHAPLIAAGCDDPNAQGSRVTIFEYNDSLRKWFKVETLPEVSDPVCDVAFAPSVGRSYHLLAVASRNVHIFSLKPLQSAIADSDIPSDSATSKFSVKELASFDEHGGQVWRVSWNITGTVLSSAGSDGTIKVWKTNYMNSWKLVSSLRPHEQGIEQDAVLAPFNVHEGQHYY